jgi:hypothetical protein
MIVRDATGVLIAGFLFVCCAAGGNLHPLAAQEYDGRRPPSLQGPANGRSLPTATRAGNANSVQYQQNVPPAGSNPYPATLDPVPDEGYTQGPPPGENGNLPPGTAMEANGCEPSDAPCDGRGGMFCGTRYCAPANQRWVRADFLAWWTSGQHLPPLVTTGGNGTLDNSNIAFGNSTVNWEGQSGWRITAGRWLDRCQTWALEGDFYDLRGDSTVFALNSTATGSPLISRPFFDVNPANGLPGPAAEIVSQPGETRGGITVEATDYFQSAGAWLRHPLCGGGCESCCDPCDPCGGCCAPRCCRVDLVAGYRYCRLFDQVNIHENLTGLPTATNPAIRDVTFDVQDSFRANNEFHGGEVGLAVQTNRGRWSLGMSSKVAIGNNHQFVMIDGRTIVSRSGEVLPPQLGGLLAQSTNIGPHNRDDFVMIPNLSLDLSYQLNCHWRAHVGYDILYWACVTRAGDQIDLNVDSARIPSGDQRTPTLPFPAFAFQSSNFWAQGIKAGFEFCY